MGLYYAGLTDQWRQHTIINQIAAVPEATNTGRANFLADPYNGLTPTFETITAPNSPYRREIAQGTITSPVVRTPYSYQTSFGVQRQLRTDMSLQADYVWIGERNRENSRQINMTYDPATGLNKPFTDITTRPYSTWGSVLSRFADGESNYHALETARDPPLQRSLAGVSHLHAVLLQGSRCGAAAARLRQPDELTGGVQPSGAGPPRISAASTGTRSAISATARSSTASGNCRMRSS